MSSFFPSPNVKNLSVGSGQLYFKPEGAGAYTHLGNVPQFEYKMKTKMLDYHVPINGIRVKAYTWTVELEAEVELLLEEITARNLQLLMLGDIVGSGAAGTTVTILARNSLMGALAYRATNEIGPKWHIDLNLVTFNNDGAFDPLTVRKNDFSTIKIKGTALAVNGSFGVFTLA